MRLYLKKTRCKNRFGGVTQGVSPEFKPHYHTQKKSLYHLEIHTEAQIKLSDLIQNDHS
jgi:hypothetical protein